MVCGAQGLEASRGQTLSQRLLPSYSTEVLLPASQDAQSSPYSLLEPLLTDSGGVRTLTLSRCRGL